MLVDYRIIDEKCIPMVKFFNEVAGLETEFCCQGHDDVNSDFYIIFNESVHDVDIREFISNFEGLQLPLVGSFYKWMRKGNGVILNNWIYNISSKNVDDNHRFADADLKTMEYWVGGM